MTANNGTNWSKSDSTSKVLQWVPGTTPPIYRRFRDEEIGHFRVGVVPVFSALDENSNFALDWSRDKSEGTKVISVLALVGVGAGIKSLSHLVN